MPINNRTEAVISVNTQLVPTISATELRTFLNDSLINSLKFDKDVIATDTPTAGAVTINFSNKDLSTVTTAVNLAVSFSNLQNGSVKYLEVIKQAANSVSFVGSVDMSKNIEWINTQTKILYVISNKNGIIYVEAKTPEYSNITKKIIKSLGWIALQGEYVGRYIDVPELIGITPSRINKMFGIINNDSFSRVYNHDYAGTGTLQGLTLLLDFSLPTPRINFATNIGGSFDFASFSNFLILRGSITIEYV